MKSYVALALSAAIVSLGSRTWAAEAGAAPERFDVSINGENFTVDAGLPTRLESKEHPGKSYRVAVRRAQLQHWKLNTVQFDYQLGFQVTDDRKLKGRTATLKHPLGFMAVITDLGGSLPADARSPALEQLVAAMKKTLSDSGIEEVKVSKPQRRKLGSNAVEAVTFSYLDSGGDGRMSAVYLITSEKFACSCLLQCDEDDREDAVDMVKVTLGSLAPL